MQKQTRQTDLTETGEGRSLTHNTRKTGFHKVSTAGLGGARLYSFILEEEACRSLISCPAWYTWQSGLHRESCLGIQNHNQQKEKQKYFLSSQKCQMYNVKEREWRGSQDSHPWGCQQDWFWALEWEDREAKPHSQEAGSLYNRLIIHQQHEW